MTFAPLLPCPPHLVPGCLKYPHYTLFLPHARSKSKTPGTFCSFVTGPPYMWTVMLSVVEWEHLTDDQKELHSTMRESWLSSYSKASHTVLQHWLWRFLKKQTESFAPLHKVFSKIRVYSPDSGTSAWTEIFLLYPITGASIAQKLLACVLKTCLNFMTDSMASALDYIASVNASVSQLSHVQPMTVQDVYALVTLMGLYLFEASGHQKAYKELLAHINDGHALMLEKVQHKIIRFSDSRAPRAFALTHAGDSSVCNHSCPRCCDTRGEETLVLRARVRPLARTPLAAPAALIVLSLPLLLLSIITGVTKASTRNTTLSPTSFRATT